MNSGSGARRQKRIGGDRNGDGGREKRSSRGGDAIGLHHGSCLNLRSDVLFLLCLKEGITRGAIIRTRARRSTCGRESSDTEILGDSEEAEGSERRRDRSGEGRQAPRMCVRVEQERDGIEKYTMIGFRDEANNVETNIKKRGGRKIVWLI